MWGIFKIKQKKKLTDIENRLVVSGGSEGGMQGEGWEKWMKGEYMHKTENKNKIKKAIRRRKKKNKDQSLIREIIFLEKLLHLML